MLVDKFYILLIFLVPRCNNLYVDLHEFIDSLAIQQHNRKTP